VISLKHEHLLALVFVLRFYYII